MLLSQCETCKSSRPWTKLVDTWVLWPQLALEDDVSLYFILHRFPISCSHRCQHEVEVLFVDLCQVTGCPS